jgi:SP family arabinose:H+ symporter-like MFS transporter
MWRFYFGLSFIPCGLQFLFLLACPESPVYEMLKGKVSDCEISLFRLRPLNWDVVEEREVIDSAIQASKSLGDSHSVLSLIKLSVARKSLLLCVFMHAIQQFSGIDVIMLFSKSWFENSTSLIAKYITVIQGIAAIVGTILSIYLIERVGRRILTLTSSLGCATSLTAVTLVLWSGKNGVFLLVPFLGFVVSFAIGLGPVTWIIINDIFPPNSRAAAVTVAVSVNWLSKFILLTLSDKLQSSLGKFSFIPFAFALHIFSVYAFRNLKETKGRPVCYL